jgi:hypothetical protein
MLLALLLTIGVVSLVVVLSPGDGPAGSVPERPAPAVAPRQPTESAGPPPAAGSPRPKTVITLAEAIAIAEKTGQGYAIKAERRDKPQLSFRVEVMGVDGQKRRIELNADGSLRPGDDGD